MLRFYVLICIIIAAFLSYEYSVLNDLYKAKSFLETLLVKLKFNPSPEAGKPLSYTLGWLGFSIMCLTNLYVIRKRIPALAASGKTANWLDFHILCGLLGPILIIFHSNFKVGGLVAISFWSMMISASSGIVGRYFFMQVAQRSSYIRGRLEKYDEGFKKYVASSSRGLNEEHMEKLKQIAIVCAGGGEQQSSGLINIFVASFTGDLFVRSKVKKYAQGISSGIQDRLVEYAIFHRKLKYSHQFKVLLGNWHAFHMPFAYFMYITAIIHIVVALMFGVSS